MRWNRLSKALRFLQIAAKHEDFPFFFYCISNYKNFIPKYPDNALTVRFNFTNIEATIEGKSSHERFHSEK